MEKPFEHEYAEFNAEGILSLLRCQCCGCAVASLMETPSKKFPGRTFTQMRHHANMKQQRIPLSDGSTTTIFLCADCNGVDVDPHAAKIAHQLRMGWQRGLEANKRPQADIVALHARTKDLKPLTKAEVAEREPKPEKEPPMKALPKEA
ncbi:MAG: hypothetical protein A2Y38_14210 [Spirochaetes bacterium GWB1_59_5]|nr:MAG: hypothetical protein A2Y38_14210 [Spirochaetes bacterium GWB1_59_5]